MQTWCRERHKKTLAKFGLVNGAYQSGVLASTVYLHSFHATQANCIRGPNHFPSVEEQKDTFLGIVDQYRKVFIALESANITLHEWTPDAIDSFLGDKENKKLFWEVHLSNTHQNHLKQKILVLNFLGGKHFHHLRKSTDGEAYVHECEGYAHRFQKVDQMVGHIQQHHVSNVDGVHHPLSTSIVPITSVILLRKCDEVNFTDETWLYQ